MFADDPRDNKSPGQADVSDSNTDDAPDGWEAHREDPEQGGAKYYKCTGCGVEAHCEADIWFVEHDDACSKTATHVDDDDERTCSCDDLPDGITCWACRRPDGDDADAVSVDEHHFGGDVHEVEPERWGQALETSTGKFLIVDAREAGEDDSVDVNTWLNCDEDETMEVRE